MDTLADTALRLQIKALIFSAIQSKAPAGDKAESVKTLDKLIADGALRRANYDLMLYGMDDVTKYITAEKSPERIRLIEALDAALVQLGADAGIEMGDRMRLLRERVGLARLKSEGGKFSGDFVAHVKLQIETAEKSVANSYERDALANVGGSILAALDLLDDSDRLTQSAMPQSSAPYYLMMQLAENAKLRSLNWYEKAYDSSQGATTRVGWGGAYVRHITELTPEDDARVERAALQVLTEMGSSKNAFYAMSFSALRRMMGALDDWKKQGDHAATVKRIVARLDSLCTNLPAKDPQVAICKSMVKPDKPAKA